MISGGEEVLGMGVGEMGLVMLAEVLGVGVEGLLWPDGPCTGVVTLSSVLSHWSCGRSVNIRSSSKKGLGIRGWGEGGVREKGELGDEGKI